MSNLFTAENFYRISKISQIMLTFFPQRDCTDKTDFIFYMQQCYKVSDL